MEVGAKCVWLFDNSDTNSDTRLQLTCRLKRDSLQRRRGACLGCLCLQFVNVSSWKKFQWNKTHTHTHLYSVSAVWQHAISDVVWCNCFISLLIDVVWCIYSLMNVLEFGCAGKRWPVMIHLDKHLPQKAFFDLLCESSAVALPLKCCCSSVSVVLSWLNWNCATWRSWVAAQLSTTFK